MAKNEAKIRFTAETGEFNTAIKKSNDTMSQLRAEMKLNEAQMKSTGASVEGLENKHKILSDQLAASQDKTEALSQKVNKAAEIFGENSTEVTKLRTQLLNAQTAEEKLRQAISNCETELNAQREAARQSESAIEKLSNTIDEQQTQLSKLKSEYSDAVLQHGRYSKEARTLAKEIDSLSGELNENQKRMAEVENAADKLDNSLDNVDETAEKVAEGFTVMKGAMADLVADGIEKVASGLADIGTEAFATANDIDKATNTFIAKTGESKESAGDFEEVMTDIYNGNYGESFEDIADAMATVKTSLGDLSDAELKSITTDAIVLRDTFDMDVNESVRAVNSLMDQFGITADEAFNLVAQGAQNGLNQNGDLLDVINEYSVQFENAGYSADDMFNMLSNGVASGTWSVDKLGDAVKEFNIRMSDGSAQEAVEALGFSWEEVSADWSKGGDSAKEVFNMLFNELDGLENTTEGYGIGVGLLGTMYEDLGQDAVLALSKTEGEISKSKKALQEINSVKYDDIGSAIEGIKRNLQTSVAEPIKTEVMPAVNEFIEDVDWSSVGQTVGEAFGALVEGAISVVNCIKDATQWMKEHKAVVATVATVIGILTAAITAYNIVQGIKAAMDAAQVTTIWALVAAHIAQAAAAMAAIAPYVLVVAAIAAVIAIIVLCIKYWDEIVAAVKKAWEIIKETLAQWGEWINTNVIQPIKEFFSGLWSDTKDGASKLWESVKTTWANFVSWIDTSIIQPIVNFFKNLWQSIQDIWTSICNGAETAWNFIKNCVQVAIMFIGSLISAAVQIITLPFRLIWENCKEYVFAAWEWIKEKISSAISAVKSAVKNGFNIVKNTFSSIWNSCSSVVSNAWSKISSKISSAVSSVKNAVSKAWNYVKNATSTAFNACKSVATSVWNGLKNAVSNAASAVWSKISSAWNSVKSATSSAFNACKSVASSIWGSIRSTVSNIASNIWSKISSIWSNVRNATSTAFNSVKSTISSGLNSAKSTITSILNSIKSKFSSIFDSVKNTVSNAIDRIKGMFNFSWSLPDLKLPHFSISGGFSLNPPSVPKLSIDWYKDGGIFTKPTIFNTPFGFKGVGDVRGGEAVLPIEKLEGYISNAIEKAQNVVNLQSLANAIEDIASRPIVMNVNGRQFATATAGDSDSVNGMRATFRSRGLVIE